METIRSGLFRKHADILRSNSPTRKNMDSACRLLCELLQQPDSGHAAVLMAGRKDRIDSDLHSLLQRLFRISAYVKCAVKRHVHAVCRLPQLFYPFQIQCAIRIQTTNNYAVRPKFPKHCRVFQKHRKFCLCIQKVSISRAQ